MRHAPIVNVGGPPGGGQSLVELALVMPLIMLLLVITADLGRAFYYQIVLAGAVREGARVGVDRNATNAQIISAVSAAAQDIATWSEFGCCTITPAAPRTGASGQTIAVTATWNYCPITPGAQTVLSPFLVASGPCGAHLPLSQTARMVIT